MHGAISTLENRTVKSLLPIAVSTILKTERGLRFKAEIYKVSCYDLYDENAEKLTIWGGIQRPSLLAQ